MTTIATNLAPRSDSLLLHLRRHLARRRADRALEQDTERLAELSPHLLGDIGIAPREPRLPSQVFGGRT